MKQGEVKGFTATFVIPGFVEDAEYVAMVIERAFDKRGICIDELKVKEENVVPNPCEHCECNTCYGDERCVECTGCVKGEKYKNPNCNGIRK